MSFRERIMTFTGNGPAVANTALRQTLFPNGARPGLPAELWSKWDRWIEICLSGRISTLAATPGTLTFDVLFEGAQVWSGGAITLNVNAKVNVNWQLLIRLRAASLGTGIAATLVGSGHWKSEALVGSPVATAGGVGEALLPFNATPGVAGPGWDSELTQRVEAAATWQTANVANSIQAHDGYVDICSS